MTRWSHDWLLLPQRFALHEPSATAVLADIHLGYSAARQRLGDAIPSRTVAEEMQSLVSAARVYGIERLVVAGDLFEGGFDETQYQTFLEVLTCLDIRLLAVVPGNHDRGIEKVPDVLVDGCDLAGWHICHGDRVVTHIQAVMGHWHPALRAHGRKQPCFLTRGTHLILPAFSLDAAGVDVRKDERWRDWQSHPVTNSQ